MEESLTYFSEESIESSEWKVSIGNAHGDSVTTMSSSSSIWERTRKICHVLSTMKRQPADSSVSQCNYCHPYMSAVAPGNVEGRVGRVLVSQSPRKDILVRNNFWVTTERWDAEVVWKMLCVRKWHMNGLYVKSKKKSLHKFVWYIVKCM